MEINKIYNEDCMKFMDKIKDNSINLIISDAPYFSTNIKEVGDSQWEKENDYIDWVIDNFKEYERTLKNNGSLYFFHNDINIMVEILYRVKKETNFKLKNQITWDKLETGNQDFLMPLYKNSKLKRRYATSLTEYIYYFTFDDETGLKTIDNDLELYKPIRDYFKKERKKTSLSYKELNKLMGVASNGGGMASNILTSYKKGWTFPTKEKYELLQKTGICKKPYESLRQEYEELRQEYESLRQEYEGLRYTFNQPFLITPKNIEDSRDVIRPYSTVWHYKRNDEIYSKHLTPKPIEMIKHILNTSSKEGDLVYIPFAGSGSDIVACIEMNRRYIATEINNGYIEEIIIPRIENMQ